MSLRFFIFKKTTYTYMEGRFFMDKAKIGKASREKGKRGEREVARIFQDAGYAGARRTSQYCGRTGDASDVTGVPGIHLEVKYVEREQIRSWYAQATRDAEAAGRGDIPVVIHRKTHEDWLVTLSLTDFIEILKRGEER
jgi:Holliday junction resolvase